MNYNEVITQLKADERSLKSIKARVASLKKTANEMGFKALTDVLDAGGLHGSYESDNFYWALEDGEFCIARKETMLRYISPASVITGEYSTELKAEVQNVLDMLADRLK